jgi:hypothetical protein
MRKVLEMVAVIVVVAGVIGIGVLVAGGPGNDRVKAPADAQPEASTQSDGLHKDHMVTTDPEAPGHRY